MPGSALHSESAPLPVIPDDSDRSKVFAAALAVALKTDRFELAAELRDDGRLPADTQPLDLADFSLRAAEMIASHPLSQKIGAPLRDETARRMICAELGLLDPDLRAYNLSRNAIMPPGGFEYGHLAPEVSAVLEELMICTGRPWRIGRAPQPHNSNQGLILRCATAGYQRAMRQAIHAICTDYWGESRGPYAVPFTRESERFLYMPLTVGSHRGVLRDMRQSAAMHALKVAGIHGTPYVVDYLFAEERPGTIKAPLGTEQAYSAEVVDDIARLLSAEMRYNPTEQGRHCLALFYSDRSAAWWSEMVNELCTAVHGGAMASKPFYHDSIPDRAIVQLPYTAARAPQFRESLRGQGQARRAFLRLHELDLLAAPDAVFTDFIRLRLAGPGGLQRDSGAAYGSIVAKTFLAELCSAAVVTCREVGGPVDRIRHLAHTIPEYQICSSLEDVDLLALSVDHQTAMNATAPAIVSLRAALSQGGAAPAYWDSLHERFAAGFADGLKTVMDRCDSLTGAARRARYQDSSPLSRRF